MTLPDRLELAVLVLVSAMLAVVELLYLPLRFDGTLLPDLHGYPFPVVILVAALANLLLVRRAGQIAPRGPVAAAPLLTWLLVSLLFGIAGPGGDQVLLPDWRTIALLAAGGFPATWLLGGLLARAAVSPGRPHSG